MGQGVHVDVVAGSGSRSGAGVHLDDLRRIEVGGARATAANLAENSPNTRCWLLRSISPKAAASQKAVAPPRPSATS